MDTLFTLNALADTHQLSAEQRAQLLGFANQKPDPAQQLRRLRQGAGIFGAILAGLGIICWIAANWHGQSRVACFLILQCLVGVTCSGAFLRQSARPALGLAALIAIGALLAFFGQTYQTGGDVWQLFALWAALTVPLCLGVRHDAVWIAWAIVALTAVSLAINESMMASMRVHVFAPLTFLIAWSAPLLLVFLLGPPLRPFSNAGTWTLRCLVGITALMIVAPALKSLFDGVGEPMAIAVILPYR
jgi:uncharacterized membrane protein